MVIMSEKLIRINNSTKSKQELNEAKKDTGSIWKKNENSSILSLENFDFSKKILYHPEKITGTKKGNVRSLLR